MGYDYLIVGLGLAGISFCEQLENHGKTYKVISDNSQISSVVAGGLYNPVILKRFTLAWNGNDQLKIALPFYGQLEKKLQIKLDYKVPILRLFASIEEQNLWFEAADRPKLNKFLNTNIIDNKNNNIDAPFGFGQVLQTGRIDTNKLVIGYQDFLKQKEHLISESFDFDAINLHGEYIKYKSIKARKLVFATGFGIKFNPYFNYLPLNGTKGELLTIKAPYLKEPNIIKSSVFIIPLGGDLYRVGSTYERTDKSNTITERGKKTLLHKLNSIIKCNYEIVHHAAGIRPTTADRRPLVGRHPELKNMYVLNGLGSRGVMIAPSISKQLFDSIENGEALPPELDIARFSKRYFTKKS